MPSSIRSGTEVIMATVDIHPHVISTDTKRYPLNPLGGTQSTWSRHTVR